MSSKNSEVISTITLYGDRPSENCEDTVATVSMFSGCGAMDLGFEQAGFTIVVANDIAEAAVKTHRVNFPETVMVPGDITQPDIKDRIVQACGGHCDVIIGGPPCIAYSMSGKRNPNDPRGRLWEEYLEIVNRLRPLIVVMENVIGMLSARRGEDNAVIFTIVAAFAALGYHVEHQTLNAADYGVPQKRRRVILIATKTGVPIRFPDPTHDENASPSGRLPWVSVKDAIRDLEDASEDKASWHVFVKSSPEYVERIRKTPIGQSVARKYKESYFRTAPDQPAVTVKANNGGVCVHYAQNRLMTPRELARLQSFPDSFRFLGSKRDVLQMIGNAVPCGLAWAVATSVREMLDECDASRQVKAA